MVVALDAVCCFVVVARCDSYGISRYKVRTQGQHIMLDVASGRDASWLSRACCWLRRNDCFDFAWSRFFDDSLGDGHDEKAVRDDGTRGVSSRSGKFC